VGRICGEPKNYGSPSLFCNKEIGESLPHAEDHDPLSHYLLTETHVEIGVSARRYVYEVRCSPLLELRLQGENPKVLSENTVY